MLKKYVIVILLSFNFVCVSNAQIFIDSLNISPNPFATRTVVYFSNSQKDSVSITIYNAVGSQILSLITDSILTSNAYTDSLKMDTFPDGIYFVHLKLGSRKTIAKKIIKQSSLGLNEFIESEKFIFYPNPTNSILNIDGEQKHFQNATINLTNYIGQTILSIPYSNQIDVSNLSCGVYTIRIKTINGELYNTKFVKNN
jgi:hypothetical protein